MTETPTRKTDAWGTLVSVRRGVLQQWYPLNDGCRQEERARKNPGHPPLLIFQRWQGLQNLGGPRTVEHGIVFANFSIAKHHDPFCELRDVKLVCDHHDG